LTAEDPVYIENIKDQKSEFGNLAELVLRFFNQKKDLLNQKT
jgi:hypothetical protein